MTVTLATLEAVLMQVTYWSAWFIVSVAIAQNALYIVQLVVAFFILSKRMMVSSAQRAWHLFHDMTMPISIIVPAYNEEASIVENVRSMLALHYPNFEVIVVNDGSRDATMAKLIEAFDLTPVHRPHEEEVAHAPVRGLYGNKDLPNLIVVDKENGGKSDALNAGMNLCRFPLFCAVDADSVLEPDALLRAVQPFAEDPDRVIAVGGTIRIANGCTVSRGRVVKIDIPTRILPLFQVVEYIRAFLMARLAWSSFDSLLMVSGAFGIFKRSIAIEAGGYDASTVGEDLELVVRMHRLMRDTDRPYAVRFIPDPVCWTEAPESWRVLGRQRRRWQRGALETFFKHRSMTLSPRYGAPGMLGFPHLFLVDVLGPAVEFLGYLLMPLFWWMGAIDWEFFVAYLILTFVFGIAVSVGSLALEEQELRRVPRARDLLILTGVAVVENFGYRQINAVWRMMGYYEFLRGRRHNWGVMTRSGFKPQSK